MQACADVIAIYKGKVVLIERLSEPRGFALPGGRKEKGESLEECAIREFHEETGMRCALRHQLHTYSRPDRDPRGEKIATVYVAYADGEPKNEAGKTRVVFMDFDEITKQKNLFAFDHYDILQDYCLRQSFFL